VKRIRRGGRVCRAVALAWWVRIARLASSVRGRRGRASDPKANLMITCPVTTVFAIPALDQGGPDKIFFDLVQHVDRGIVAPQVVVSEPEGFYLSRLPVSSRAACLTTSRRRLLHRYPVVPLARFVREQAPSVVVTTLRMNDPPRSWPVAFGSGRARRDSW